MDIVPIRKQVAFRGDSRKRLGEFPPGAKREAGFQLDRLQRGMLPVDYRPMPDIGSGVEEIRIREQDGIFRVIYTARLAGRVYVLHAFQKKTQQTAKQDLARATRRFNELMIEVKQVGSTR